MRNRSLMALALSFASVVCVSAEAQTSTWTIDPAHSSINFEVRHMGVSNVHGSIGGIKGTVAYDEKDITKSSVEATADTNTVSTGVEARDKHLKSPDFFEVEKFPTLSFKSTSLSNSGGKLTLVNCWMHARRQYVECAEAFPQAEEALEMIAGLYAVEREYKQGPENLERLLELRQLKSRPLIERLQQWASTQRALPQSALGQAIKYMSNRWTGLTRFLNDTRVPLDNGATERAMRGLAVGRENHYGSRSRRGTEVAALFYSLLETAKLGGVDPKRYLREAALAALRAEPIPLPNQLAQSAAG